MKKRQSIIPYMILFIAVAVVGYGGLLLHGQTLIWQKDGVGQYYPAFLYIGCYLRNLIGSFFAGHPTLPLFDLSIGFGEDIIGTLNYYGFGDPFNLVAVLAVGNAAPYVYTALFFVRACLAGITFLLFVKEIGLGGWASAPAAVCYAFCGFMITGGAMYAEWGTLLVYFPLMLLAAEKTMKRKRGAAIMTAAVGVGALSGFYFLYMASLALMIYVIVRLTARQKRLFTAETVRVCGTCLGYYLLGIGLASPILMPAIAAYMGSQRAGTPITAVIFNPALYKPFLNQNLINALLNRPREAEDIFLTKIPVLESTAVILLIVLPRRFLPGRGKRRQLIIALVMIIIAASLPITGYLFNGFGETNDRWSFIIYLFFAVTLCYVFKAVGKKYIRRPALRAGLSLAVLISLVITIVSLYQAGEVKWGDEFLPAEGLNEMFIDSPAAHSQVIQEDDSLYRVANTRLTNVHGRPDNSAMLNDYNGLSYWWSIVNGRTQAYVNLIYSLGYRWRSYGLNTNSHAETLVGVRYWMADDTVKFPPGYEVVETITWHDQTWWIAENSVPSALAYVRSKTGAEEIWAGTVGEGAPDQTDDMIEMAHHHNLYDQWDTSGVDGSAFCTYVEQLTGSLQDPIRGTENLAANQYGQINDVSYAGNHMAVSFSNQGGDQLVLSLPYSPNWKAEIDGRPVALTNTDVMFTAVNDLPAGHHVVELNYSPKAFYVGCLLGLVAIALAIFLAVRARRTAKRISA